MRLIDADALKKQYYPFPCAIGVENAVTIRAINEAPTIDAVPVVRGEWIEHQTKDSVLCSYCHADWNLFDNDTYRFCYCPNCGARMEVEQDG